MITIGIIDDEIRATETLKVYIENCMCGLGIENDIRIFLSGEDALENKEQQDIIFLDIEMPGMDGIETGRKIREKNLNCIIIMATGNMARFKEAFKINAFRYITKPYDKREIEEALESGIRRIVGKQIIEVFHNRVPYHIMERDIYCIRAYNSYTLIVTGNMEYRSECSLKEFEELLDKRIFFKANRSHLVNLLQVKRQADGGFYLAGKPLEISRRLKKEFQERFIKVDTELR